MPKDLGCDDLALGLVAVKQHFGKLFGAPTPGTFHQNRVALPNLALQMLGQSLLAQGAQARGTGTDFPARHGRHTGGRRAFARGVGKDMQPCQPTLLDQPQ